MLIMVMVEVAGESIVELLDSSNVKRTRATSKAKHVSFIALLSFFSFLFLCFFTRSLSLPFLLRCSSTPSSFFLLLLLFLGGDGEKIGSMEDGFRQ